MQNDIQIYIYTYGYYSTFISGSGRGGGAPVGIMGSLRVRVGTVEKECKLGLVFSNAGHICSSQVCFHRPAFFDERNHCTYGLGRG